MRQSRRIMAIALMLAAAGSGCSIDHGPYARNCGSEVRQPTRLSLACADENAYDDKIVWAHHRDDQADGYAVFVYNDCSPDCAGGHFKSYRVHITLSGPVPCGRHRCFSRVTNSAPGRPTQQFPL
jgi:hypothetical protein